MFIVFVFCWFGLLKLKAPLAEASEQGLRGMKVHGSICFCWRVAGYSLAQILHATLFEWRPMYNCALTKVVRPVYEPVESLIFPVGKDFTELYPNDSMRLPMVPAAQHL